jgi:(S)-mandelate dehydrogenase
MAGDVRRAFCIDDFRGMARQRLPRAVFDFYDGGAEEELTLRRNREAFQEKRFLPRVLIDVARIDTGIDILGAPSSMPLAVGPTGAVGFGWRGGDVAIAKAAAAAGIPYTLSTTATTSIETIAREAPGRLWFQAYILKNRAFLAKLIQRAQDANYEALMITVDLPVGGKRERDARNDFSVPFRFTRRNFLDFASRPAWALEMLAKGMPVMENVIGAEEGPKDAASLASSVGRNFDASFDWARLQEIRDTWPRKLIVKGIMRGEDAARAAAMGVDAIIVSNHGGRQLDGACATLDALPGVLLGAAGKVPVMVDGGVRRGADIVKARALGAHAVLVGRATLYAAVAAGEPGAHRALAILRDELERTMRLTGVRNVGEITRDLIA